MPRAVSPDSWELATAGQARGDRVQREGRRPTGRAPGPPPGQRGSAPPVGGENVICSILPLLEGLEQSARHLSQHRMPEDPMFSYVIIIRNGELGDRCNI